MLLCSVFTYDSYFEKSSEQSLLKNQKKESAELSRTRIEDILASVGNNQLDYTTGGGSYATAEV
jgi:hypothetical protein